MDEDLQAEYKGALDTGLFDIIIFVYESWFVNHRLILTSEPVDLRRAIYRGWMMKPDEYENFIICFKSYKMKDRGKYGLFNR